jgi:FtsH-binding integral membrane protein
MNSSMAEARSVAVSEAQKAYLTKVYGWMVGGLFTTALVGGIIVSDQQIMMDVLSYRWILIIAQFGLVIALSDNTNRTVSVYGKMAVGVANPKEDVSLTVAGSVSFDNKKFTTGDGKMILVV